MKNFKNVSLESAFKDLKNHYTYSLVLNYKEDEKLSFSTDCKINMKGSSVPEKFVNILTGKTQKEFLAFGMCDIDLVALPDGRLCISESPYPGVLDSYELDKESCEELLHIFKKELTSLTSTF